MRTRQSEEVEATTSAPAMTVCATLVGLSSANGSSILSVRLPGGGVRQIAIPAGPDPTLARGVTVGLRRLSWVRIDLSGPVPRCEVSGVSRRPRLQQIPLAAALALADAGLAAVVRVPKGGR